MAAGKLPVVPRRQVFFQPHPGVRPVIQITAVGRGSAGQCRGSRAVYSSRLRLDNRRCHGTDHDFKPLPSPSGIRLPIRPLRPPTRKASSLQAIEEGQAQYFANDRLRKMAGVDVYKRQKDFHARDCNMVSGYFPLRKVPTEGAPSLRLLQGWRRCCRRNSCPFYTARCVCRRRTRPFRLREERGTRI